MATNIIHLTCQHCGAALEIDLDNLIAYCPHCGQKLLFDVDQLGNILYEKEKNKHEREKTRQKELKYEHDLEKKKLKNEQDRKMVFIIFGIIIFMYLLLYFIIKST